MSNTLEMMTERKVREFQILYRLRERNPFSSTHFDDVSGPILSINVVALTEEAARLKVVQPDIAVLAVTPLQMEAA